MAASVRTLDNPYRLSSPPIRGSRTMPSFKRWPQWVYGAGSEPDYRFSFANERTFLAWIRTALALLAAGVALDALDLSISAWTRQALAVLFVALGLFCAVVSWFRWARAELAMRRAEPLPPFSVGVVLMLAIVVAAIFLLMGR
jgi:putative membrane protein